MGARPRSALAVAALCAAVSVSAHAARPTLTGAEQTVASADGRFLFHYTRTGDDAVSSVDVDPQNGIPDYVDDVMEGVRRGYEAFVSDGGWPAPPGDGAIGGDARIDVYIKRISCAEASGISQCGPGGAPPTGLFGVTWTETPLDASNRRWTSYILINPANDVPLGRNFARSVAAHELHHVIQFAMDSGLPHWVYESTAAYLQMSVFDFLEESPYIVDALLLDRLARPEVTLASLEGRLEYSNALWFRYLVDRFDAPDLVRAIWTRAAAGTTPALYDAMDAELQQRGSTFDGALVEWGEWNYFLCGRDDGRHYAHGDACVSPNKSVRVAASHRAYPVADATTPSPEAMAMTYVELYPDGASQDLVLDLALPSGASLRARALRVESGCTTASVDVPIDGSGHGSLRIERIHETQRVAIVVANVAHAGTAPGPIRYSVRGEGSYTGPAPSAPSQRALEVTPSALVLATVGETAPLLAVARYSDCTSLNATRQAGIAWRSLDPTIARVNDSGVVTAAANGRTQILAAFGGVQATVDVRVGPEAPTPTPAPKPGCSSAPSPAGFPWIVFLALLIARHRARAAARGANPRRRP